MDHKRERLRYSRVRQKLRRIRITHVTEPSKPTFTFIPPSGCECEGLIGGCVFNEPQELGLGAAGVEPVGEVTFFRKTWQVNHLYALGHPEKLSAYGVHMSLPSR